MAQGPYLFHLVAVSVSRKADPSYPTLARVEALERRLVGLRQYADGTVEQCPVEQLLLLKGGQGLLASIAPFALRAGELATAARGHVWEKVARPLAEARRRERLES